MDRQVFLAITSSAQWALFLALALIIYSWIERKRWIQFTGQGLFVALALYSVWVLTSGMIVVPEVPEGAVPPSEARALTFFFGLSILGIVAAIGLVLNYLKSTLSKIPNLILVPIGILLFFMVYHLQRF
ncbi:hypothetical protein [Mangrovibacterium diazotrophicum]|uniref:Uncharacterized protein n=1 Tax=Mangrovibacterium diazotrophicum TaxID=1261403 RepID=A0A419VWF6_9BACT|nr:hypothetical protein [Mangrovibacterium diazotrophicum]RKD86441.1 hypothetical protein BC643_4134 [Mangrovibacterium diazotrophicum]